MDSGRLPGKNISNALSIQTNKRSILFAQGKRIIRWSVSGFLAVVGFIV
jgi:hypothetical protein